MIDPCGCQGGKSVQPMPKQDENDNVIFRDEVPEEPWVLDNIKIESVSIHTDGLGAPGTSIELMEKEDDCSD